MQAKPVNWIVTLGARRIALWVIIAVLSVWALARLRESAGSREIPLYDFIEYWSAGRIFLEGGNPYSEKQMLEMQHKAGWDQSRPIMMWNPPWTLVWVVPFALLPYWTARGLWFFLNLAIILVSADWFWRLYGGPPPWRWLSWIVSLMFFPVLSSLYLGQISPLILAGVAGLLWAFPRQKLVAASLSLMLIAIKPHLLYVLWIVLILWVIKSRSWRFLTASLSAVSLSLLVILAVNLSTISNYLEKLRSGPGPLIWQTPTWGVALSMLLPDQGNWLRFVPTVLGSLMAIFLWKKRWGHESNLKSTLSPILYLSIITSSFTWMFDWVVLIPALVQMMVWFIRMPRRNWVLPMGFLFVEAGLTLTPAVAYSNFYTIWMPPALGCLHLIGVKLNQNYGQLTLTHSISE